jgi:hypothetical protein
MKLVRVHKLDGKGGDVEIGVIFIRNEKIDYAPLGNHVLESIVNNTVQRYPCKLPVSGVTASEPDVFLESIHRHYRGAYLRVGPVVNGVA